MRLSGTLLGVVAVTAVALPSWAPREAGAGPPRVREGKVVRLDPRDPEPLVTAAYLDIALAIRRGALRVLQVRRGELPEPRAVPRFRGRFEVRLYAHKRLLDLCRFSFPLTRAAGERTAPNIALDRALARGVSAQTSVRVPFSPQVTRVVVIDTRTGRQVPVDVKRWRPRPSTPAVDAPKRTSVFSDR